MTRNTRRLALPFVQVCLAISLTASNFLRPNTVGNPSWTAPDRQFCWALNAPVSLAIYGLEALFGGWLFSNHSIELLLETIVFFVLVGALWYGVSLEFGGKGQSVLATKTGIRSAVDAMAVIVGVLLIVFGVLVRSQFGSPTIYSDLVATPYIIWGIVVVIFYAHDFRVSLSGASTTS